MEQVDIAEQRRRSFRLLRYMAPDVVRNLRAAMDVGSTAKELKELAIGRSVKNLKEWPKEKQVEAVLHAIDYMQENSKAGVVKWLDGQQYDWEQEEIP